MKFILSLAAASLLASASHPAFVFAGQISPRGNPRAGANGRTRGKIDSSRAGDLKKEKTMSIQGLPDKRIAKLERKAVPGLAVDEWSGETGDGTAVANLRPCRANPSKTCGSFSDYEEGMVCSFKIDAEDEEVVECTPYSAFPPDADPQEIVEPATAVLVSEGEGGGVESPNRGLRRALEAQADAKRDFRAAVAGPAEEASGGGARGLLRQQSRRLETAVMDVMVVWTPKAECAAAGAGAGCVLTALTTDNMRTLIDLAVQETNTAYFDSGIDAQLRLVHAYLQTDYVEASSDAFGVALNSITGTTDGVMDDVHTHRTTYGADIVAMLIDDGQYCGLGWLGPNKGNMFSVSSWSCATGYFTFGHEIGHNQGCNHDRGTKGTCTEVGTYNYGWRDPAAQFRTIMAYGCVTGQCDGNAGGYCAKVQQFSNPTNTVFEGKVVGDASNNNAQRINDVKDTIASYFPANNACTGSEQCGDSDLCTQDLCASGVCINPPANCDDEDVCTTDSCSNGACTYTDINCDDGNSCTTDTCDAITGCAHETILGCCGNNICEAGEDAPNCAIDCALGPFDLTTAEQYCSSCTILDGLMFDVKSATSKIQIQTMSFRTYAAAGTLEVWTKSGTHVGSSSNLNGWVQMAAYGFSVAAWSTVEIPQPDFTAVNVDPAVDGGVRAFYVTLADGAGAEDRLVVTGGTSGVGAMVVQDSNGVQILEALGKTYLAAGTYSGSWIFNGGIEYFKIPDAPAPTASPVTPTDAPTTAPTTAPTKAPTNPPSDPPTKAPTKAPTDAPIKAPFTPAPTGAPVTPAPVTFDPTKAPTTAPTDAPTKAPTDSPTKAPTDSPIKAPTTPAPTGAPATPAPTEAPATPAPVTFDPTKAPTNAPTKAPTKAPTDAPTKAPTTPAPTEAPVTPAPVAPTPAPVFPCLTRNQSDCRLNVRSCCSGLTCRSNGKCR